MAKKMRLAAACAAVLLVFARSFSLLFVITEADHHCSGEHCAICHQIQACQQLLDQLSTVHTAAAGIVMPCLFALQLIPKIQEIFSASSPVSQKVKLLN